MGTAEAHSTSIDDSHHTGGDTTAVVMEMVTVPIEDNSRGQVSATGTANLSLPLEEKRNVCCRTTHTSHVHAIHQAALVEWPSHSDLKYCPIPTHEECWAELKQPVGLDPMALPTQLSTFNRGGNCDGSLLSLKHS